MSADIFKYVDVALQTTYDALATKDANTLYGIQDTQRFYFGTHLVADKNVLISASLPQVAAGKAGYLYVVTAGNDKGLYSFDPTADSGTGAYVSLSSITEFIVTSIRPSSTASDAVVPSEKAIATAIEGVVSDMDWKPAVANYAAIATTYPDPEEGWTTSTTDTNQIYRYDAGEGAWVNIFTLTADIVVPTGETGARNGLMTADMAAKLAGIEDNAEANANGFGTITVGSSTVSAASDSDSFELVAGTNVSLTVGTGADANKITIAAAATSQGITALTGYTIASAKAALAATDSLNDALGKLEYRIKAQEDALVTVLDSTNTDAQIPSAKAVYDAIAVQHI